MEALCCLRAVPFARVDPSSPSVSLHLAAWFVSPFVFVPPTELGGARLTVLDRDLIPSSSCVTYEYEENSLN